MFQSTARVAMAVERKPMASTGWLVSHAASGVEMPIARISKRKAWNILSEKLRWYSCMEVFLKIAAPSPRLGKRSEVVHAQEPENILDKPRGRRKRGRLLTANKLLFESRPYPNNL